MLLSTIPRLLLKNIIVATDFSPVSEVAIKYGAAIARHHSSKVTLVHAMPPVEEAEAEGRSPDGVRADAEFRLRAESDNLVDVECEIRLIEGNPLQVVEQVLSLEPTDLIVVGTHGTGGFRRLWRGSAAEQIFCHICCPVLVMGPSVLPAGAVWEPSRILLATDLESDEFRAVEYAIAFADEHHAQLALLHVTPGAAAPYPEDTEIFLRPYFESRLQRIIPSWLGLEYPAQFWVEFGNDPVTETMRVVRSHAMDLLVLSVHPREPWTSHFHHDAHRMVAEAPCPVLVVQRSF
jgi:nucleotide-binding universal stress UspA family protein